MTYTVEFSPSARKMFKKLPQDLQDRIQPKIDALATEPRPNGVKKLKGEENTYRIKIGSYRVVYEIEDDVLLVIVIKVAGRKDDLPALEYLKLWFGRYYESSHRSNLLIDSLLPFLFNESSPHLSYLGLRSSKNADELARAVAESPIIERLAVLDLSMGNLTDKGAKALLNSRATNQLHTLNISNNCVSANMIQELSQLNCRIIANGQEEVLKEGLEPHVTGYYTSEATQSLGSC